MDQSIGEFLNNPNLNAFLELYNILRDGRSSSAKVAIATYDFAVDGGAVGAIDSGVEIPKDAVITKAYVDVLTTCASAGSDAGTMAVHVVSADDIVAAIAISDGTNPWDKGLQAGVPVGTAATMIKTTAPVNIIFTIATQIFSAGKMNVVIEYTVSN